jgi:hypothetical protein
VDQARSLQNSFFPKMKPTKSKLKELLLKKKEIHKPESTKTVAVPRKKPIAQGVQKKPDTTAQLSQLQQKMQKKLQGSQFRWINEQLYTTESTKSFDLFQKQPELFDLYHQGFASQVEQWPVNPVDVFIEEIATLPKNTVVCDMGCGEAKIAQMLHKKMTIHSFDLVAGNDFITACDIAHVPLKKHTVDVVIFCLSLMGTNFVQFLQEARRILKKTYMSLM